MSQRWGNKLLNAALRLKANASGGPVPPRLQRGLDLQRQAQLSLQEANALTNWEHSLALLNAQRPVLVAKGFPAAALEAASAAEFLAALAPAWRGVARLSTDEWLPVWGALCQAGLWDALRLAATNQLRF